MLTAAYHAHPGRFVRKPPAPPGIPDGSLIDQPARAETDRHSVTATQRRPVQVDRFRQQRSLRRMCQVLSWPLARSPGTVAGHVRAWSLLRGGLVPPPLRSKQVALAPSPTAVLRTIRRPGPA